MILFNISSWDFDKFFVSRANGEPPLYLGLIESEESLSFLIPTLPILSFPKALSCLPILDALSLGLPKGFFSLYPSGTLKVSGISYEPVTWSGSNISQNELSLFSASDW